MRSTSTLIDAIALAAPASAGGQAGGARRGRTLALHRGGAASDIEAGEPPGARGPGTDPRRAAAADAASALAARSAWWPRRARNRSLELRGLPLHAPVRCVRRTGFGPTASCKVHLARLVEHGVPRPGAHRATTPSGFVYELLWTGEGAAERALRDRACSMLQKRSAVRLKPCRWQEQEV